MTKMVSTRGVRFKFAEGEKVLCYEPDPTKAKVLYDSKVLGVCVSKEGKGRKIPEYLIHFSGWSSTWDRYVTEEFILKDNDENRCLQRRLAEAAAVHIKSKKQKRRLSELILKDTMNKRKCSDLEVEDWKGSTESTTSQSTASSIATGSEDDCEENKSVDLEIPRVLKKKLEDDCVAIKERKQLHKLPCEPNVISILEGYVKSYASNILCGNAEKTKMNKTQQQSQRSISLCKEVMDGLRIYFDFTLPILLLYNEERSQFEQFLKDYKPITPPPETLEKKCTPAVTKTEYKQESESSRIQADIHVNSGVSSVNGREIATGPPPGLRHGVSQQVSPVPISTSQVSSHASKVGSLKTAKTERTEEQPEKLCPKRVLRSSRQDPKLKSQDGCSKSTTHVTSTEVSNPNVCPEEDQTKPSAENNKEARTTKVMRSQPTRQSSGSSGRIGAGRTSSPPYQAGGANAQDTQAPSSSAPACVTSKKPQPPPPIQIPSHVSSVSSSSSRSGPSTPTTGVQPVQTNVMNALSETMSWRIVPSYVYLQNPPPPSLIYGAHHLLRLFVKLPDMITRTFMPERKLDVLLNHLELFLKYLDNKHEDFFVMSMYTDENVKRDDDVVGSRR